MSLACNWDVPQDLQQLAFFIKQAMVSILPSGTLPQPFALQASWGLHQGRHIAVLDLGMA